MPDSNVLQFPTEPGAPSMAQPHRDMGGFVQIPESSVPPDHEARTRALDIRASFIVEAPAGSGKTGLLMQRFLKLLAYAEIDEPEEVLAITFTRKATAELRERILHQLQRAALQQPDAPGPDTPVPAPTFEALTASLAAAVLQRNRERNWGLLIRPDRLHIRTIDSVSTEIASTLPLLSGSAAGRTPSDDPDELYSLAAERTLMQLGGPDTRLDAALHTVLRHRDANLGDVRRLLAAMLQKREQWGELIPLGVELDAGQLDAEVRPRLERALESVVCAGLNRATRAIPPDMLHALSWLAARFANEPSSRPEPSPLQICANKTEPPEERAGHLEHWIALINLLLTKEGEWRKGFAKNHLGFETANVKSDLALLKQLIEDVRHDNDLRDALHGVRCLPPARYPDAQWEVAKALFQLLYRALAELKVLFAERAECDFSELTLAARQALNYGGEGAGYEGAGGTADLSAAAGFALRHLLVDEMQDTSSSQYELIQLLSQSWDGHSETVFLVGDPKQSIYLFRQARVERFLRAVREQRLAHIPLQTLYLTSNFRSQALLVDEFNEDFSATFPQDSNTPQDVLFVAADPTRQPSAFASGRVWHTCVQQESTHDREKPRTHEDEIDNLEHRRDEARAIRHIVDTWRSKPLPPGRTKPWSIAVLARGREHLTYVIQEFHAPDEAGATVPFTAVEIERLGERPEVLDLLALTRALLHPADRVAWLAVLHAPWCGLDLADMLALSGNGAPETQYETIPATAPGRRHLLSPTGQTLFDRTWPVLEEALRPAGEGQLSVLVERTWRSLGGDAALDERQMANGQLYFAALRKAERVGALLNLERFAAAVDRLFAEPITAPGAVTLSTIHKAKGLEWDVVLVPGLERPARPNSNELLNWLELDDAGGEGAQVVLAPIAGKGSDPHALYAWISSVRSARDAAERKRLFYVACTRAREELHLFAAANRRASGELCAPAGSLLQSAWEAALPHFMLNRGNCPQDVISKSLEEDNSSQDEPLSIAAAEEISTVRSPLIHRLPLSFSATSRFSRTPLIPTRPSATSLPQASFARPEGSFAVRAFGNVVHRFLQLCPTRLSAGVTPKQLAADLPLWGPRLAAGLRAEGLAPATVPRLAERGLRALTLAIGDPDGLWLLSPHPDARTEGNIRVLSDDPADGFRDLRTDRSFRAGATPGAPGDTHLWIIDFKTSEQGSRSEDDFASAERAKYAGQLAAYARAFAALPGTPAHIMVALYYPLVPKLLYWPAGTAAEPL